MSEAPGVSDGVGPALPIERLSQGSLALAAMPLLGGIALSLIYWPGLVTYESIRQYDQALSGKFDDWHPPMMGWIWRGMIEVWPGPAPMLLLQLILYGGGVAGLAIWAIRRGRLGLCRDVAVQRISGRCTYPAGRSRT